MRLDQIVESVTTPYDLNNQKSVDSLAQAIAKQGFPKTFSFMWEYGVKDKVPVTLKLESKKMNDHPGYHVATFNYWFDTATEKRVEKLNRDDLNKSELDVHAELGSEGYEKVHGKAL